MGGFGEHKRKGRLRKTEEKGLSASSIEDCFMNGESIDDL